MDTYGTSILDIDVAQSSKERSAHHLCVHAHARPGRPAANPCEATVAESVKLGEKNPGNQLEVGWKMAGNWGKFLEIG